MDSQKYNSTVDLGIGTPDGLKLLSEQKQELLKLLEKGAPHILNGLVHLIDHIQDSMVEENKVPMHVVFPGMIQDKNLNELKVGDDVIVDDPKEGDLWNHEFNGTIVEFKSSINSIIAVICDQEDNHYDVELSQLTRL